MLIEYLYPHRIAITLLRRSVVEEVIRLTQFARLCGMCGITTSSISGRMYLNKLTPESGYHTSQPRVWPEMLHPSQVIEKLLFFTYASTRLAPLILPSQSSYFLPIDLIMTTPA
jgi:hypothetical protein